jgi:hypothetical protein
MGRKNSKPRVQGKIKIQKIINEEESLPNKNLTFAAIKRASSFSSAYELIDDIGLNSNLHEQILLSDSDCEILEHSIIPANYHSDLKNTEQFNNQYFNKEHIHDPVIPESSPFQCKHASHYDVSAIIKSDDNLANIFSDPIKSYTDTLHVQNATELEIKQYEKENLSGFVEESALKVCKGRLVENVTPSVIKKYGQNEFKTPLFKRSFNIECTPDTDNRSAPLDNTPIVEPQLQPKHSKRPKISLLTNAPEIFDIEAAVSSNEDISSDEFEEESNEYCHNSFIDDDEVKNDRSCYRELATPQQSFIRGINHRKPIMLSQPIARFDSDTEGSLKDFLQDEIEYEDGASQLNSDRPCPTECHIYETCLISSEPNVIEDLKPWQKSTEASIPVFFVTKQNQFDDITDIKDLINIVSGI